MPSKTTFAVYIVWVFLHLSLFIFGNRYNNIIVVSEENIYRATKCVSEFFPFNINNNSECYYGRVYWWVAAYDITELFVYLGTPIFVYLFFVLIKSDQEKKRTRV